MMIAIPSGLVLFLMDDLTSKIKLCGSFGHDDSILALCKVVTRESRVEVNLTVPSMTELERTNPRLLIGGHSKPSNCTAIHKIAMIIPYRDRPDQLRIFLRHIHLFLAKQNIEYKIYVTSQNGVEPFNRGYLMNVGFVEAAKDEDWNCYIFHDVDLLPEDERNVYTCQQETRHMSVAVDKLNYVLPYASILGGALAIMPDQYRQLNGHSNEFWGWGGEDDDFADRHKHCKINRTRYSPDIARYTMIRHKQEEPNKDRINLLQSNHRNFELDGLTNLNYTLLSKICHPTYTNLVVDLHHTKV